MTRRLFLVLCAAVLGGVQAGCANQKTLHKEFYEPTSETLHRREDGYFVGALKSETVREGSRDEGDKTFAFGLLQSVGD